MFRRLVEVTPLYNDDANIAITNITGDIYRNDSVFLSTMRALLTDERIGDDSVRLRIRNHSFYDPVKTSDELIGKLNIEEDQIEDHTIYIINIAVRKGEEYDKLFGLLESDVIPQKVSEGWAHDDVIREFYKDSPRVYCLTNSERKSTLLMAPSLGPGQYHYIAAAIPRYFPWYFPQPKPELQPLEMQLLEGLTPACKDEIGTQYMSALKEIAERYDFRSAKINKLLKGFAAQQKKMTMSNVRDTINQYARKIDDLLRQYQEVLKSKQREEIFLTGLKQEIAKDEDSVELVDYFQCHRNLTLLKADHGHMEFEARGYLSYFDEEAARTYINNTNSDWYYPNGEDGDDYIPTKDMQMLLNAIFVDQTLRLRVCAAYSFTDTSVYAMDSGDHGTYTYECDEYLPNPHHWYHSCIAEHGDKMHQSLSHGDYIGAIEQAIASTITFNVHDETVMGEFMADLYGINSGRDMPCIETPDGSVLTTKEAIDWLKEQEA